MMRKEHKLNEPQKQALAEKPTLNIVDVSFRILPLEMIWQPKEDITTYELAMCLPYFLYGVMSYEVDKTLPHFRHFKITDHNVE